MSARVSIQRRALRDAMQSRHVRIAAQVLGHTQPREESDFLWPEARARQGSPELLSTQLGWHKVQVSRLRYAAGVKALTLEVLSHRVADVENRHLSRKGWLT